MRRVIAGLFSGLSTLALTYPFDVIRVRMHVDMTPKGQELLYKGFFDCMKSMIKNEGVMSI